MQGALAARDQASEDVGENDARFAAARLLIFSAERSQRAAGAAALQQLLAAGFKPSEAAFWLAVAHLTAGEYRACRQQISSLVRAEPTNERAAALLEIIKERVRAEGQRAWLWIGAAAVVAAGAALWLWSRSRHRDAAQLRDVSRPPYGHGGAGSYGAPRSRDIANDWKSRYGAGR